MLTDEQLKEIQERREKASCGPWKHFRGNNINEVKGDVNNAVPIASWMGFDDSDRPESQHAANASFIAHSWEDIGTLLDHISALKAQQEKLVEALEQVARWPAEHMIGTVSPQTIARTALAQAQKEMEK